MAIRTRKIELLLLLAVGIFSAVIYYFFYTGAGAKQLFGFVAEHFVPARDVRTSAISGRLSELLVLNNLEFHDPVKFPPGTVVRIQTLRTDPSFVHIPDSFLEIENGRVFLPASDAFFLNGTYQDRQIHFNLVCRVADTAELVGIFLQGKKFPLPQGQLDDIDIDVAGTIVQPVFQGKAMVKNAVYNGIMFADMLVSFRIAVSREGDPIAISGPLTVDGGTIQARRTMVNLEHSRIDFENDWRNPRLNIKGNASVESVNIHIDIQGTKQAPQVALTSNPALSQEQLMVMLATGQRWQGMESSLKKGQLAMDVTRDFVDYFLFGGSGHAFAAKFGIEDFTLILDKDKKGFGIKKKITDTVKVDYSIEQTQQPVAPTTTEQKVGAELDVTDHLSVGAQKELPAKPAEPASPPAPPKDEIYLKYKKNF